MFFMPWGCFCGPSDRFGPFWLFYSFHLLFNQLYLYFLCLGVVFVVQVTVSAPFGSFISFTYFLTNSNYVFYALGLFLWS